MTGLPQGQEKSGNQEKSGKRLKLGKNEGFWKKLKKLKKTLDFVSSNFPNSLYSNSKKLIKNSFKSD